jgi:hypothetical protein
MLWGCEEGVKSQALVRALRMIFRTSKALTRTRWGAQKMRQFDHIDGISGLQSPLRSLAS